MPANSWVVAYTNSSGASGNVFVTGSSAGIGSGAGWDFATIKYSNAGASLWTNSYDGPDPSFVSSASAMGRCRRPRVRNGNFRQRYRRKSCDREIFRSARCYGRIASTTAWEMPMTIRPPWWWTAAAMSSRPELVIIISRRSNILPQARPFGQTFIAGRAMPLWTNRYNGAANGGVPATVRRKLLGSILRRRGSVFTTNGTKNRSETASC